MQHVQTSFGDLLTSLFNEYLALYGDDTLAAMATARALNALLAAERKLEASPHPRQETAA